MAYMVGSLAMSDLPLVIDASVLVELDTSMGCLTLISTVLESSEKEVASFVRH